MNVTLNSELSNYQIHINRGPNTKLVILLDSKPYISLSSAATITGLQEIFNFAISAESPTAFYKSFVEESKRFFIFGEAGESTENVLFISQAGEPAGRLEFKKSEFEEFALILKLACLGASSGSIAMSEVAPIAMSEVALGNDLDAEPLLLESTESAISLGASVLDMNSAELVEDSSLDFADLVEAQAVNTVKEVRRPSVKRVSKSSQRVEHDSLADPGY